MKAQLLIGVGISVLLIVFLEFGSAEKSVFSKGPLAKGHDDISCGSCHSAFSSFRSNKVCVDCHEEQKMTPVSQFKGVSCIGCHKEHNGRNGLKKVSNKTCMGCHNVATVHLKAPIMLAAKLKSPPRNCQTCHKNHVNHRLHIEPSLETVRAHLVEAHLEDTPYFHKDTCVKCHQDKTNTVLAAAKPGYFDPHATHVQRYNMRCTWCHESVDILQKSGTRLRRNVNTKRCVECHEGWLYPKGTLAKTGGGKK